MEINRPLRFLFVLLLLICCCNSSYSQSLSVPTTLTATLTTNSPEVLRNIVTDIDPYTGKQVYVWGELDTLGASTKDIYCAIYDKDQNVLVSRFRVNTGTTGDQAQQRVRINPNDGSFVVAWGSLVSGNWDVFAKKINLNINQSDANNVHVAIADVAVNSNATLKPNTQYYPLPVFCEISGELLIGFTGVGSNGTNEVYYQRFNYPAMTIVGGAVEQQLNTIITNQQNFVSFEYSTFSNQVIASYHSNSNTTNGYDVYRRIISYSEATGTYSTDAETIVNTTTAGDQQNGHIAVNQTTGNYSITWTSNSSWKVFSKMYNASNAMIKDEFSVLGAQTSASELGGRSVWDESSNVLILFWHNYASTSSYWYSMVDGNSLTYITGSETQITSVNTNAGYSQYYFPAYNKLSHKIALAYDVLDGLGGSIGYSANFSYAHPSFNPPLSTYNMTTTSTAGMNFTDDKIFNGYGDVISESRVYYDLFGKELQTQVLNPDNKTVMAQMPLYDYLDRATLQTLPGVINNTGTISYNPYFVSSSVGQLYTPNYWDGTSTATNPGPVTSAAGVGSYYGGATNTYETGVAQTSYPYTRTKLADDMPGGSTKQTLPGDAHILGSGHEMKSISLPVLNELDHYETLRNMFITTPYSTPLTSLKQYATKTISTDPNGITALTFNDKSGNTIATARTGRAGITSGTASSVSLTPDLYYMNLPANYCGSSGGSCPYNILDIDINASGDLITVINTASNSPIYTGPAEGFAYQPMALAYGYDIQISSSEKFAVKIRTSYNIPTSNAPADIYYRIDALHISGQPAIDLHLQAGNSITLSSPLSLMVKLSIVNLDNGQQVYSGSVANFNASVISEGFYRFYYNLSEAPCYQDYTANFLRAININYTQFYQEFAYYFYDDAGRLVAKTAPNGVDLTSTATPAFTDTYTYSTASQLLSSTEVDAGTTNYIYKKDGQLRFSQNAQQAVNGGSYSFIQYDDDNRVITSGEYILASNNSQTVFHTWKQFIAAGQPANSVCQMIETSGSGFNAPSIAYPSTEVTIVYYSQLNSGLPLRDATGTVIGTKGPQRNTWNRTSCMVNYAGYGTWYSYDNDGRLEWTIEMLPGLEYKTIDYVYDQSGNLLQTIYQKNNSSNDRFDHVYKYDKIGRLKTAWTRESTGKLKLHEKYQYYVHGPLKRKELGDQLQGIDYIYTIQGWLKGINHHELNTSKDPGKDGSTGSGNAAFAPDAFGMSLDYFDGDYTNNSITYTSPTHNTMNQFGVILPNNYGSNDLYNGSIRSVSWLNTASPNTGGNPNQMSFEYDYKYQLYQAIYGIRNLTTNNFVYDPNLTYLTGAVYDLNGNLAGKVTDKTLTPESYSYTYAAGTNKLTFLQNPYGTNRTYSYNAIGQMTNQTDGTVQKNVSYYASGLMKNVKDANGYLKVAYEYNVRGNRAKKITYAANNAILYTTWYVTDVAGNEVSIYDTRSGSTKPLQSEVPVYGSGRTGVYTKSYNPSSPYALLGTAFVYELKDHLGNVRAVINRTKVTGNTAQILSWADYYPFGEVMRASPTNAGYNDRYGYQGEYAECDIETATGAIGGWNSFDLRMYDANVGRWLSRDPKRQYWSPYTGMGNNPVNGVDPTGGVFGPPGGGSGTTSTKGGNNQTYKSGSTSAKMSWPNQRPIPGSIVPNSSLKPAINVKPSIPSTTTSNIQQMGTSTKKVYTNETGTPLIGTFNTYSGVVDESDKAPIFNKEVTQELPFGEPGIEYNVTTPLGAQAGYNATDVGLYFGFDNFGVSLNVGFSFHKFATFSGSYTDSNDNISGFDASGNPILIGPALLLGGAAATQLGF